MKIHGNRVYLELPAPPESKISISPELQNELKEAYIKTLESLVIIGIGEGVNQNPLTTNGFTFKIGDKVFISPEGFQRGIKFQLKGKDVLSVSSFDIMHTWDD